MHVKPALRVRKRTAAIVAAVSVAGLAVGGAVVVDSAAATPATSVVSRADTAQQVGDLRAALPATLPTAPAGSAPGSAAASAPAAASAAAARTAAAKAAVERKAAAARVAEQKAAAKRTAERKAATARVARAAERRAAARSAQHTSLGGSPRSIAARIVPAGQLSSFDEIISHESGWDVHATNASSGAYGLGQALPGSKMASAGSDWRDSAETQIRWALHYMDARYGSPNGAWSFWQAHNWY